MIFTQNEKMRLDRFLSANLNASRSQITQLIAKNAVKINDKVANKSGILLKNGDKIEVDLCESMGEFGQDFRESSGDSWQSKGCESNGDSQDSCDSLPKIARIYEDNDFLVLNKPPFLATHGAPSLKEKSLVDWLKARRIELSTISGETREGIIHRLDKQTSGAIVVAKNNRAHRLLSAQLADKSMGRIYLAIIDLPLKCDIEVECYLARNPKNRLKISKVALRDFGTIRGVDSPKIPRGARYAKSKFFKLATSKDGKKELICAKLFTGRTHQIRAHLESINRHIVGDELYGYKATKERKSRVMLHSYLLYLLHPKDFCEDNLSLGMQFRTCENFGDFADTKSSLNPQNSHKYKSHTAIRRICERSEATNTSIVCNANDSNESSLRGSGEATTKQSKPIRHTERSEVSKTRESSKNGESMTEKRINESNSPNQSKNPKMLFLAPLFDDMQSFLEQHFDMGEVNEILRTLPSRFGF